MSTGFYKNDAVETFPVHSVLGQVWRSKEQLWDISKSNLVFSVSNFEYTVTNPGQYRVDYTALRVNTHTVQSYGLFTILSW